MIDLRILKSALEQLEQERGIPKAKTVEAIEMALAAAYRKDYGKKNQIIRAVFNLDSGTTEFFQVKEVVDASILRGEANPADAPEGSGEAREVWNENRNIMLADAQMIKKGAEVGDELIFPLELRDDFGRIAAQTANQTIIQKIHQA